MRDEAVAGRLPFLVALVAVLAAPGAAQRTTDEALAPVLRRAQAEHWMVRVTTTGGDTIAGRVSRAMSTSLRLQSPDTTIAHADIVRVEHGRRDDTDPRTGTGIAVAGVLVLGAAFLALRDTELWIVAGLAVLAVAGLAWFASSHADEAAAELLWVEAWPGAEPAERVAPDDAGIIGSSR